ncbi:amine acid ABC transporter, permease protein, 3-TM region, His/Glu/Gln/Arg/opine family [Lachnobacterium bovis DSM 14045]|uniref:Amine acid ABC transporter, permease protein, 3-TM region, His/Glu/Gln/Arg/opine family n=2 Tax=Lachnobacterium bovis TaxID=140626 RepID=A0A1H3HQC1_9FIRM|nr:amine acid ABC transporter, permease protein, 3-TM region, His/Glu/Gln/Arg/opine family [Lachnobacterium bovis DSM 14045]
MDIMQAVCDELDMELQIEDMEFDSIITAVQSGKADLGASGMTVTEERKKNIDFTDSYTTSKQVVIVNNGKAAGSTVSIAEKFKSDFVTDNRYEYILSGLKSTIIITILALIIGIVFGSLLAIVRTTHDKNGGLIILNFFAKIYLTIIRGTPTMVQLLIIYYVVFASANVNKIFVAVIAFGLNSSAYVAEVVRSGIMSVDNGQFEAGRSLGLSYSTTMINVILPQAFKNILPALGNELITLLKETSISGYIGLIDLTKGSDIIRSVTYDAIMPLGVVALIYLFIVMLLTAGVNKLERSLRKNEQR